MSIQRAALALLVLAAAVPAQAQRESAYPRRPIRIIVPLAPGGAIDIIARSMSTQLASRLGQTIIVDNRPGAGETIGIELTARATPDGHTVVMPSAAFIVNPLLYPARYDPIKDFAAVTQVTRQPYVMIVHPSVPAANVRELVAWAKANAGRLNYASAGSGSLMHLTGELFKSATGVSMNHVPYKGMALAYPDILAGQVQVGFPAIITALPHLKSGKIRALGVTSRARVASLPDVPTIQESGVPGFEVEQSYSVLAPAGTPPNVIARLHKEFAEVARSPELVSLLTSSGSEPVGSTPAELSAHIKAETNRWSKIIRQAGIRVE
ncbi:MAG: Bug family tripartite tricarboxylate transporter substrate binding protein [Burkholderiales bacterium]